MKTKLWLVWFVGAVLLSLFLYAEGRTATVEWDAVTVYSDNTPITAPVSYQVYTGPAKTGPWTRVGFPVSGVSASAPDPAEGMTLWYNVTASVGGKEGAFGEAAALTVVTKIPGVVHTIRVR
jgi:hypothetical protein